MLYPISTCNHVSIQASDLYIDNKQPLIARAAAVSRCDHFSIQYNTSGNAAG